MATVERTNPVTQPPRLTSSADSTPDPDEDVRAMAQACPEQHLCTIRRGSLQSFGTSKPHTCKTLCR